MAVLNYILVGKGGNSLSGGGGGTGGGAGGQVVIGTLPTATIGTFPIVIAVTDGSNTTALGFSASEGGRGGYYDGGDEVFIDPTTGGSGIGGVGGTLGFTGQGGQGATSLASGNTGGNGYISLFTGNIYGRGGNGGLGTGNTANGVNGTANTGNGATGAGSNNSLGAGGGATGGSGKVEIAYLTGSIIATGGTITIVGDNTIHSFNSNSNFIITDIPTPTVNNYSVKNIIFFQ